MNDKYNVIVIGTDLTGRQTLIFRFVQGRFFESIDPTIDDKFEHDLIVDDENANFIIERAYNEQDYICLRINQIRTAKGIIITYAIDNRRTFENAERIYEELSQIRDSMDVPIVLCGTKCDLEEMRDVSTSEGEELAERLNVDFFEISSRTNVNIENVFITLARKIRQSNALPRKEHANNTVKNQKRKEICEIF